MRLTKMIVIVATIAAAGALATIAFAAVKQSLSAQVTPTRAGTSAKPRGVALRLASATKTNDGTAPPATSHIAFVLPKELMLFGAKFLSWGGTIVIELYRRRPEAVASLILADTYVGWKGSLPAEEVQARVDGVRAMVAAAEFVPMLPGLFAGDPPAAYTELLDGMLRAARREALLNEALVLANTDLRDVLPTIDVPTLLIWGELDVRSPLSVARAFEQAIPGAKLVVIEGAGHVTNLEDPERFNAAIREWCRAQAATASSR